MARVGAGATGRAHHTICASRIRKAEVDVVAGYRCSALATGGIPVGSTWPKSAGKLKLQPAWCSGAIYGNSLDHQSDQKAYLAFNPEAPEALSPDCLIDDLGDFP